jgi:CubicO group peptidase (beta-lactamase class C family)
VDETFVASAFRRTSAALAILALLTGSCRSTEPTLDQDAGLKSEIEPLADRLAAADSFSGVVLLKHHGRSIVERAYGLADRDASKPNTPDTTFSLGSVGKMFTAVLVAQLVEQNRVRLDATIGSLLPDFPDGPAKSQVTVHQLLTMSSGIPDVFRLPPFWTALASARTLSDFWPVFGAAPLEFMSGSKWAYSNSNFLVLGAIVEHGFGEAFTTAAERRIFQPAGLTHTGYRAAPSSLPARGYTHLRPGAPLDSKPDSVRWYPAWQMDAGTADPVAAPIGGGYSTAGDLVRFADAVTGAQLLRRPASERATTGYVTADYGGREAYGFETRVMNKVRIFGHQGAAPGLANQVDVYPDLGYVLVVLGNSDAAGTQEIAKRVRTVITGSTARKTSE